MRKIDHIVYSVFDLESAVTEIGDALGIYPVFGGYHSTKGTKNALLDLGKKIYLEILAIDETNTDITAPRWMGIDEIDQPRITRWALKTDDVHKDSQALKRWNPDMGAISKGSRYTANGSTLSWQMILPLASPMVDTVPFVVDWASSEFHPTDNLKTGCGLIDIKFEAESKGIQAVFSDLHIDHEITSAPKPKIEITIVGPDGQLTLS